MIVYNLLKLSLLQLKRHRIRTLLTLIGTVSGLFLYIVIESFQSSLERTTSINAEDDILIVYRDKRFCPFASRLPEDYLGKIQKIEGVKSVVPIQVIVNHCGTSVDTITFRGLPKSQIDSFIKGDDFIGNKNNWSRFTDAAIVGTEMKKRRGIKMGDIFDAAGIKVRVVGFLESDDPQKMNSLFVHLDFLQQASGRGLGEVTQFNVKVNEPQKMAEVAQAIDETFRYDREPTHTRPEKAFIAQTAKDMVDLVSFTRYVGLAAVVAVLLLILNTIAIAVRGRLKENAVMQVLGYTDGHLVLMIVIEGLMIALLGGSIAVSSVAALLHWSPLSISAEGLSLVFLLKDIQFINAYGIALVLGLLAGLLPGLQLLKGNLVSKLRSV